ncbi:MAG: SusC/RagA family TonB-linked outer membrane protein [Bacteroidota bacterium]
MEFLKQPDISPNLHRIKTLLVAGFTAFFFMVIQAQAQELKLDGLIAEKESGLPLPGATILSQKSRSATITDRNGHFSITAVPGDSLTVQFLGFRSEVYPVKPEHTFLNIQLEEDQKMLYEVVVTGALGLRRASRETGGGTQVVTNEQLNQGNAVNPLTGLTSKVSGLRINTFDSKVDPEVRIIMRGSRSLNRNANSPLYVVDGVPVPDISRLNPNDIENITVLKGANAAALYGSDGVNGALMITTRRGSGGREKITFSHSTSFSRVFLLPGAQTRFGQGQNGVYDPTQSESWGPEFDGTMRNFGPALPDGTQSQILYAAPGRDNRLGLFQTGINMQNNISFSGGKEGNSFYLSLQDTRIEGILPGDHSARTGARINGSRRFGRLTTDYSVNYIKFNKNFAPDGPWLSAYTSPSNIDFTQMKAWKDPMYPGHPVNYFTDQLKNPFFLLDNYRQQTGQHILNGKIELDLAITSWLSAIYRLGMYQDESESRNTTGKFEAPGKRNVNGMVTDISDSFQRYTGDFILSMNKKTGDYTTRLTLGQNFRADNRKLINVGAANLLLPDLFNPGSRIGELTPASGTTITEYRSLAVYGELTAGYKDLVFVTATGRNDWVSVLSPTNRSYFYPGISTSWIVSETFQKLKNSDVLSFAKMYASWNRTGNVTLDPYRLNNPYAQVNGFPFGSMVGFTPGTAYPNPEIQPEFVTSYEAGTQISMFNHRLHLEAGYVFSDSEGQIFNATVSRATGYSTAIVNAGRLTNRIVEFSLSGDPLVTKNQKLNIGINFSRTANRVEELYEGNSYNIFRQSYAIVGESYPSLLVSDYRRDPQGRIVINDKNGYPEMAEEETLLGTMVPPWQAGIHMQYRYRSLSLGMQWDSRWGGWLYSEIIPRQHTAGTHPRTVEYNRQPFIYPNSVIRQPDGSYVENTTVYSPGNKAFWDYEGKIQRNTAAPSDFLKLRELALTWNVPDKMINRQQAVRSASVSLTGTNLLIIRHRDNDHGDPEYLYNSTDGYISFRQVPPYRTYGFQFIIHF